jgi:hypothetical protein
MRNASKSAQRENSLGAALEALRSVNREQTSLYADIGRMIVERQQGETWGKSIVGNLANDLRREVSGRPMKAQAFSVRPASGTVKVRGCLVTISVIIGVGCLGEAQL